MREGFFTFWAILAHSAARTVHSAAADAAHTVEHDFVINSILCGCQRCLVQLHWQCAVDDGGCSRCIFIDVRRGCRGQS